MNEWPSFLTVTHSSQSLTHSAQSPFRSFVRAFVRSFVRSFASFVRQFRWSFFRLQPPSFSSVAFEFGAVFGFWPPLVDNANGGLAAVGRSGVLALFLN